MPQQDLAQTRKDEYRVITFSVLAAISVYIADAAIDTFIFHDGPFLDVLMTIAPGELSVRLYISASFLLFGIIVSKIIANRGKVVHALQSLNLYGGKLNAAKSLDEIYELTVDAMEKTLGFEHASFFVSERRKLRLARTRHPAPSNFELILNGTQESVTTRAAVTHKPILVSDVRREDDYMSGNSQTPAVRSELAVPVVAENEVLGVLDVESEKVNAFDWWDMALLQILASHAATATSNLVKREEINRGSNQMASLMKTSTEVIHCTDVKKQLQIIAEAIRELGWRRVVIRVTDRNMDIMSPEDMVTVGLADEEKEILWNTRRPGRVWRERIGPQYERFRIGEFFYLPMSGSWVRDKSSRGIASSKLVAEEMVDSNNKELLYAPLLLAGGQVVGLVSIDDPVDGMRPTKESLGPLELFLHEAAVAIENARLIKLLNSAKTQVQEYANQLEEKVEDRTRELVEAQKRLLKSERLAAIGELAGMVGHDIRNPLTGIAGATYYIREHCAQKMDCKTKEMLEIIEEDIGRSNKIIDDLLEYSREIRIELTESNPRSLIREALSTIRIPTSVRTVNQTENKPKAKVDTEKIKRVFINIVRNALDAMPQGGTLTIKSRVTGGNLEISFADTGKGMPRETLEKLWTPLFTTKAQGMGFGLAICKRIVEAHGGNIFVESTVGKGTAFTVSLPVNLKPEKDDKITIGLSELVSSKALR